MVNNAILTQRDYGQVMKQYLRRYPQKGYGDLFRDWANQNQSKGYNSYQSVYELITRNVPATGTAL